MISIHRKTILAWSLALLVAATVLDAQQTDKTVNPFKRKDEEQVKYQQNLQNVKIAIMDGAIDPKEYVVGPGDVYAVSIWTMPPIDLQIPVTPEGSVVIPAVGEIQVAGMHLDEAKKKVFSGIRKKFISSEITFTLLTPRVFAVTVQGVVKNEGTVYLQATERVDAAVAQANLVESKSNRNESPEAIRRSSSITLIVRPDTVGSLRKIIIRHKDGSRGRADLEKYFVQKDPRLNPVLQDGDVIIVPKQNLEADFIGVYGAVNGEGAYEYVQGDSLIPTLGMARGLVSMADSEHVEITQSDSTGRISGIVHVNIKSIVSGSTPDIALHRGDRIVVRILPELRRNYNAYIEGEVLYPGYYPITRDSTLLSQVVVQAGGFKETASLSASQIIRRVRTPRDTKWMTLENERGALMQEDSVTYKLENEIRTRGGEYVVADFTALFENNDKSKDITLQDGDRIIIPIRKKSVYVFGQVIQPGHIPFVKDEGYKYYIKKAGGASGDAVKGDIRVIKAGTKQWLSPSETTIEEGDYIWVPKEPYRPTSYYLLIYSQLFSIVGTVATLVFLGIQVTK